MQLKRGSIPTITKGTRDRSELVSSSASKKKAVQTNLKAKKNQNTTSVSQNTDDEVRASKTQKDDANQESGVLVLSSQGSVVKQNT